MNTPRLLAALVSVTFLGACQVSQSPPKSSANGADRPVTQRPPAERAPATRPVAAAPTTNEAAQRSAAGTTWTRSVVDDELEMSFYFEYRFRPDGAFEFTDNPGESAIWLKRGTWTQSGGTVMIRDGGFMRRGEISADGRSMTVTGPSREAAGETWRRK